MLLQIDPLGLGPIQPDPTLGIWLVSMGFRLWPLTWRLCLSVRTSPLGDPPLGHAMQYSSLRSGSKRPVDRPSYSEYQSVWSATKGQFNSHWSTDHYTVIIHWSHRLPVTPVLVYWHRYLYPVTSGIPGTPGQTEPV